MFSAATSERIFSRAWEDGYIKQSDWQAMLANVNDRSTQIMASRLMHAIRRGRLTIVD